MSNNNNIYPFAMDCSIDAEGNILVYELQPLAQSSLYNVNYKGSGRYSSFYQETDPVTADINQAFKKAFPGADIVMNGRHRVKVDNSNASYSITTNSLSDSDFEDQSESESDNFYYYTSNRAIEDDLNDKLYQRLFLPKEVSPKYFIFALNGTDEQRAERVSDLIKFFKNNGIDRIVLKSSRSSDGDGNKFLDLNDVNFSDTISSFIDGCKYKGERAFLAEEQKIYPRISKKTGASKEGLRTFRVVGIAKKTGTLGYFVLSQNISFSMDSHERNSQRVYLDGLSGNPKYKGSKDKYYRLNEGPFLIRQDMMEKIGIAAFKFFEVAQKCDNVSRNKLYLAGLEEQKASLASPKPVSANLTEHKANSVSPKKTIKCFAMFLKPGKLLKHLKHKKPNKVNAENSNSGDNSMNNSPRVRV